MSLRLYVADQFNSHQSSRKLTDAVPALNWAEFDPEEFRRFTTSFARFTDHVYRAFSFCSFVLHYAY